VRCAWPAPPTAPLEVLILHPPPPMDRELSQWRNQHLATIRGARPGPASRLGLQSDARVALERRFLENGDGGTPEPACRRGTWRPGCPRLALPIDRTWVSAGVTVARGGAAARGCRPIIGRVERGVRE